VQASQRRVVAMSDAERRRIERDLHDGAQQRLVSVAFHLRVALRDVNPATAAQLTGTEARIHDALAHLRQLAHGMFPSVLADEGLEAALEELLVASDIPATLDVQIGDVGAAAAMADCTSWAAAALPSRSAARTGSDRIISSPDPRLDRDESKFTRSS